MLTSASQSVHIRTNSSLSPPLKNPGSAYVGGSLFLSPLRLVKQSSSHLLSRLNYFPSPHKIDLNVAFRWYKLLSNVCFIKSLVTKSCSVVAQSLTLRNFTLPAWSVVQAWRNIVVPSHCEQVLKLVPVECVH